MKSYQFNKLTSVFHVYPVNDHEFRHNIAKLPVDPQARTTLAMFKISTDRPLKQLTSICFFYGNKLSNCSIFSAWNWANKLSDLFKKRRLQRDSMLFFSLTSCI